MKRCVKCTLVVRVVTVLPGSCETIYLLIVTAAACNMGGLCPYMCAQAHARLAQRMRRLAEAEKDLVTPPGTMVTLQYARGTDLSDPCDGTGMMSYPNFDGNDKPLQYVDLRLMATAAEDEGVDLRLVYLSRSALDIAVSTTRHHAYDRG